MMKNKLFCSLMGFLFVFTLLSCDKKTPVDEDELLTKVTYTESFDIFINPERGFYHNQSFRSGTTNVLTTSTVESQRALGRSLFLTLYYLTDYRDKPIPADYLERIETNMKALREGGSKCVLRFAYVSSESDKPWDATQEIVLQHIQQVAPILQEYSDVIYVMEAGFVGVWGEWYYTSNFGMTLSTPQDYAPRRAVLDALLTALPQDRMICVRTPQFKLKCFDITFADTISVLTAYNGSNLSRIAAHNDCFLASSNDYGTFSSNSQREFWHADSKYVVMGGETCGVSAYSTCENALTQMENFHWSYLNSGYHGTVLGNWRSEGCFDEIARRLGYRFVLTEGKFTPTPEAGKEFVAKINVKNVGFAAPANPRELELIFVSKSDANEKYVVKPDSDPRYWFAGGEYTISIKHTLSTQMAGKEFDLYLHLPDPEPTLYGRPEFSIRLANDNVWDATTGYNKIHSITVP